MNSHVHTHSSVRAWRAVLATLALAGFGLTHAAETPLQNAAFDADSAGWYWEDWSAPGSSLSFDSSANASVAGGAANSGSLKLTSAFHGNGGYQQSVYTLPLAAPIDLESAGSISLDVRVEGASTPRADGDYGFLEIVLRQGSGWTWVTLPGVRLTGTEWQRVTLPIPPGETVNEIRAVSVKLGDNDLLGPVTLNIDNVSFLNSPDDVLITGADSQILDSWVWESWSAPGVITWSPVDVAGRSTSGSIQLDHQFENKPGDYQQTVFTYALPSGEVNAEENYSHVNMDIKIDAASTPRAGGDYGYLQVFLRNGAAWNWIDTEIDGANGTRILDNEWHRLSFAVKPPANQVHRLTFKIGENALLGPVTMLVDNITWTRNTEPPAPPTLSVKRAEGGLSLVTTSTDQYGRHNIYTADNVDDPGWLNFVGSTEPVSYSFNITSFPSAETYPGFQGHIFLVPGAPGTETSPDWNQPTLIFMDIKANAAGGGNATFRIKTDQPGGNGELYAGGFPVLNSTTILGTWTVTYTGGTSFTMTAPDGTVSDPIDIGADFGSFGGQGEPLRVYFGAQPNAAGNRGQVMRVGGVQIKKGATTLLEDNFNGAELSPQWVPNATEGGVLFVPATDAGLIINWTLPDSGFVLKKATTLTNPVWTEVTATPVAIGAGKQVQIPKSELPTTGSAFFILEKTEPVAP